MNVVADMQYRYRRSDISINWYDLFGSDDVTIVYDCKHGTLMRINHIITLKFSAN